MKHKNISGFWLLYRHQRGVNEPVRGSPAVPARARGEVFATLLNVPTSGLLGYKWRECHLLEVEASDTITVDAPRLWGRNYVTRVAQRAY